MPVQDSYWEKITTVIIQEQVPTVTLAALPQHNPLSRDTVILTFQINEFIQTKHNFVTQVRIQDVVLEALAYVIKHNFCPPVQYSGESSKHRTRSAETPEPRSWPANWAVDKSAFKQAVSQFEQGCRPLRRLFEPPSTGNTPSGTPERSGTPEASPPSSPRHRRESSDSRTGQSTGAPLDPLGIPKNANIIAAFLQAQAD